jgi:hypothetical protein
MMINREIKDKRLRQISQWNQNMYKKETPRYNITCNSTLILHKSMKVYHECDDYHVQLSVFVCDLRTCFDL